MELNPFKTATNSWAIVCGFDSILFMFPAGEAPLWNAGQEGDTRGVQDEEY